MKRFVSCLSTTLVLGIALALPSEARADEPPDAPVVDLATDDGRATIERRTSTVGPNGLAIVETGIFSLAHWEHACVAPCQLRLDPRYTYRVAGDGLVPTEGFSIPRGSEHVRVDAKMGSSTGRVGGALVAGGGALALAAGAAALIATPILESEDVGSQGFRSALFAGGIGAASVGLVALGVGALLWFSNGSSANAKVEAVRRDRASN